MFKADHSRPCIVPLRLNPCVPVDIVVCQIVLHWGHTHVIVCDYGGVGQQIHGKIKSANYLYLETVQSFTWDMSAMPLEKLKKNIK